MLCNMQRLNKLNIHTISTNEHFTVNIQYKNTLKYLLFYLIQNQKQHNMILQPY